MKADLTEPEVKEQRKKYMQTNQPTTTRTTTNIKAEQKKLK